MDILMDAESLVLAVLGAVPRHEVGGKKRLQKLAFFAVQAGAKCNVRFFLRDFGPFSTEVANATDVLSFFGAISEREAQLPKTKRYYKIYCLQDTKTVSEDLPEGATEALRTLNE